MGIRIRLIIGQKLDFLQEKSFIFFPDLLCHLKDFSYRNSLVENSKVILQCQCFATSFCSDAVFVCLFFFVCGVMVWTVLHLNKLYYYEYIIPVV